MALATAFVIYDGTSGTYEGGNKTIVIDCARLRAYSPRQCWLKRRLMPGDGTIIQYLLTFDPNDPEISDSNTLQGWAIEVDGADTMIDISGYQALVTACNCGDCTNPQGNIITRFYASGIPAFVTLTQNVICVTRADDGSGYSHDKMVMDYTGRYLGTIRLKSNTSGVSVYTFVSMYTASQIIPVLSDVIVGC